MSIIAAKFELRERVKDLTLLYFMNLQITWGPQNILFINISWHIQTLKNAQVGALMRFNNPVISNYTLQSNSAHSFCNVNITSFQLEICVNIFCAAEIDFLTGDTRKIFISNIKTVDESNSACVLIGCKPIIDFKRLNYVKCWSLLTGDNRKIFVLNIRRV